VRVVAPGAGHGRARKARAVRHGLRVARHWERSALLQLGGRCGRVGGGRGRAEGGEVHAEPLLLVVSEGTLTLSAAATDEPEEQAKEEENHKRDDDAEGRNDGRVLALAAILGMVRAMYREEGEVG
jgi:hypothetical protein